MTAPGGGGGPFELSPEEIDLIVHALVLLGTSPERVLLDAAAKGAAPTAAQLSQLAYHRALSQQALADRGTAQMTESLTLANRLAGSLTNWLIVSEAEQITKDAAS